MSQFLLKELEGSMEGHYQFKRSLHYIMVKLTSGFNLRARLEKITKKCFLANKVRACLNLSRKAIA
jgi:hypothetical protein